jgi:histidine ammonia-lyase/phenylalanine ammonia-lyase
LTQNVASIHLIALCQALDLRGTEGMSPKTKAVQDLVRSRVPFLDGDRRMDKDVGQAVGLIRSGELRDAVLPP